MILLAAETPDSIDKIVLLAIARIPVPKAELLVMRIVPAFKATPPVNKVFGLDIVTLPVPFFTRVPVPITAPAMAVFKVDVPKTSELVPRATVVPDTVFKSPIVVLVAGVIPLISNVPTFNVTAPAAAKEPALTNVESRHL